MWLIHTTTHRLVWFIDETTRSYAILSHRWEAQEASFRLLENAGMLDPSGEDPNTQGNDSSNLENQFPLVDQLRKYHQVELFSKPGWEKVTKFCQIAKRDGYDYGWIDTCCINKDSSAELQEAINSMFKWYHQASRCYVYMNDVAFQWTKDKSLNRTTVASFRASKWFTRGWTLQELLAPKKGSIFFLNCTWSLLGSDKDLRSEISSATLIPEESICPPDTVSKEEKLERASVAQKMSWASSRMTTRSEDEAYCLLGIFGIQMPLLYGEGRQRAFQRLQLEILRTTNDVSIFAWNAYSEELEWFRHSAQNSMLATSPSNFHDSSEVLKHSVLAYSASNSLFGTTVQSSFWIGNSGLELELNMKQIETEDLPKCHQNLNFLSLVNKRDRTLWTAYLNCGLREGGLPKYVFIYIVYFKKLQFFKRFGRYVLGTNNLADWISKYPSQRITIS